MTMSICFTKSKCINSFFYFMRFIDKHQKTINKSELQILKNVILFKKGLIPKLDIFCFFLMRIIKQYSYC